MAKSNTQVAKEVANHLKGGTNTGARTSYIQRVVDNGNGTLTVTMKSGEVKTITVT